MSKGPINPGYTVLKPAVKSLLGALAPLLLEASRLTCSFSGGAIHSPHVRAVSPGLSVSIVTK